MVKQVSEVVNGVRIVRDMTPEEENVFDEAAKNDIAEIEKIKKLNDEKNKNRLSALAKLVALGLTEDEIAAL